MDRDDAMSVASDDGRQEEDNRRAILAPAIHNVVNALGGMEGDTYVLGDECYGCLKDLKKFWRKDATDDERTVARIFWEQRVLPNDLIPILLETAGKGRVTDKCAIACADIITAMTWPIDLAAELKELDEEFDKTTDYTQLLQSHLYYKAALLRPGVIQAFFAILLPCIAKDRKERKERDGQIINVILHLFRNLAFIRDRPPNMHASADQAELSSLQSKLIRTLSEAHVLELLSTIASNSADPFLNQWNTLTLEILYLLYRGVSPASLAIDQRKSSQNTLAELMAVENNMKLANSRHASSRHSRFGTTISVTLNPAKIKPSSNEPGLTEKNVSIAPQTLVLHRQEAIVKDSGSILDLKKRKQHKKVNKVDELGMEDNLSHEAKVVLQNLARNFIEICFNTFLASVLKDIKSERPKITEKDHVRLLFVTRWFLEFFISVRSQQVEAAQKNKAAAAPWGFDLVSEVVERSWIVWILKRMRGAVEDKPKAWTELQAGIECLTQLLILIDAMRNVDLGDEELTEASGLLQQQIIYNGEVLDIATDSLRSYREGVQSLKYLDASVCLGYTLLRMLEKWSKERGGGELLVRRKKAKRQKEKDAENMDEEPPEPEDESDKEQEIQETLFTFESFEMKFAHEEITHTLLSYLSRYQEFTSSDQMKRVVNLLHRQAIKAKAEGLFFKVSTLYLFKNILSSQNGLSRDQPYKDLVSLLNFILRKFFKAVNEDSFLILEAFFPKNGNKWKQYSSWQPEEKESTRGRGREPESTGVTPAEVKVKKGYSWSEELAIAIACLVEKSQKELIDWVKDILKLVIHQRQRIVEETDGSSSQDQMDDIEAEDAAEALRKLRQPSNDALAKFEDYSIPYVNDEKANAATKNPELKLLFRLVKFSILDENADELEWYVPAAVLPTDLQRSLNVINQFLENPLDLNGESASRMLVKKSRRRRRRYKSVSGEEDNISDEEPRKRRTKKKKEQEKYKSAEFIEDSDVDFDDEKFWEQERQQRELTELAAMEGKVAGMRKTGTKKRKKGKRDGDEDVGDEDDTDRDVDSDDGQSKVKKRKASTPPTDDDDELEKRLKRLDSSGSESDSETMGVDAMPTRNTKSLANKKTKSKDAKKVSNKRSKTNSVSKGSTRKLGKRKATTNEDSDTEIESDIDPSSPPTTTNPTRLSNVHGDESEEQEQIRKPKPRAKIIFSDEE